MKVRFFNDSAKTLRVHPATPTDALVVSPYRMLEVELPDNAEPFIKVWDRGVVLIKDFRVIPTGGVYVDD